MPALGDVDDDRLEGATTYIVEWDFNGRASPMNRSEDAVRQARASRRRPNPFAACEHPLLPEPGQPMG